MWNHRKCCHAHAMQHAVDKRKSVLPTLSMGSIVSLNDVSFPCFTKVLFQPSVRAKIWICNLCECLGGIHATTRVLFGKTLVRRYLSGWNRVSPLAIWTAQEVKVSRGFVLHSMSFVLHSMSFVYGNKDVSVQLYKLSSRVVFA